MRAIVSGLVGVRYYPVVQVGRAPHRSENGGGMVADPGIGVRVRASAARVNRTALAGCGKAVLRGGYYAIGGVQLGFFG